MPEIKAHEWFKVGYIPATPNDEEEDKFIDDDALSLQDVVLTELHISHLLLCNSE